MSKKEKKKVNTQAEEPIVLDIPEDEIWTYQVEGLAAPHVNKPYKHYGLKKVIFALVIIVAVSLSMYFSVRTVQKETFEYEQTQSGYTLTKFSNNGSITSLDIDYVSTIVYSDDDDFALVETGESSDFIIKKDETKVITAVGPYTLNCDEKVKVINIGAQVTSIDPKAFYSCWALRQIEVDENNPNYCDIDGVLYSKDKKTIICRPCDHDTYLAEKYGYAKYDENGYRIEISGPDNNDYKKHYFYYNICKNSGTAEFADFETVEKYFEQEENSKALEEFFKVEKNNKDFEEFFKVEREDEEIIGKIKKAFEYIFSDSDEGIIEKIVKAVDIIFSKPEEKENYNYTKYCEEYFNPYYEKYTNDVLTYVVPSTVETIGQLCFNYANMKNVYLPEGLTTIETLGFFEIPLLENIYSYKGENADAHFAAEDALGEVYVSLPETLEYIGSDAFSYNMAMNYIYIPESVMYIGHHAFWDTVYKEGNLIDDLLRIIGKRPDYVDNNLKSINRIYVAASEEEFDNVEKGDSWRPQYDYMLFKKSVEVVYGAERKAK